MRASRGLGFVLMTMLVAAMVRPAASDRCSEVERDERGQCPAKRAPARAQPAKPARPVPPAPSPGKTGCPVEMIRIPAGTFRMGSLEDIGDFSERPQHEVTLSSYCIDRTEVTVKPYAACVAARGCPAAPLTLRTDATSPESLKRYSQLCNGNDRPGHPINCVDWDHATAYCRWAGKRLPTEAEWEYAARGDDGRVYPWGNETPSEQRLNACGTECSGMAVRVLNEVWDETYNTSDGWESTAPVGSFSRGASPFGVLDMAGNVWEWTADLYARYARAAVTNPQGATTGTSRVCRGGGWGAPERATNPYRAAYRGIGPPTLRLHTLGFRCARAK